MIVAAILRREKIIVPRGGTMLMEGDALVLGAEPFPGEQHIDLQEVVLRQHHSWNGEMIKELDISRQTIIVMVKRDGKVLIPKGSLRLLEGDTVVLYSQKHISQAHHISI